MPSRVGVFAVRPDFRYRPRRTTEPHRRAFYAQLLDFLSRNIGGAKAVAQAGKADD